MIMFNLCDLWHVSRLMISVNTNTIMVFVLIWSNVIQLFLLLIKIVLINVQDQVIGIRTIRIFYKTRTMLRIKWSRCY